MAQVSKAALRVQMEASFEDLALIRAGILRQLTACDDGRSRLAETWKALDLGDVPEYEPEIRIRRVS